MDIKKICGNWLDYEQNGRNNFLFQTGTQSLGKYSQTVNLESLQMGVKTNLHWGLATRNPLFFFIAWGDFAACVVNPVASSVYIERNNRTKLFAQTTAVAPRTDLLGHPPHLFIEVLGGARKWLQSTVTARLARLYDSSRDATLSSSAVGEKARKWNWLHGGARV